MKIAITGHTTGIGKCMADFLVARGHTVIGFSRSTGYDIADDNVLTKIVDESKDVDIFINNATFEFQQTKLMFKMHDAWKGKQKTIVSIGAAYTQRWDSSHPLPMFRTTKLSLDEGCKYLWNTGPWPRIMLAKPCVVDTPKSSWSPHPNKVSPEDTAEMICNAMLETRCRIQEIAFEVNPIDATTL